MSVKSGKIGSLKMKYLGRQISSPVEEIDRISWNGGEISVSLECTEFSSICPVTGQPDFGNLTIEYLPEKWLAETKSVKLYLWKFRDEKAFNEVLVDRIASELWKQIQPKWLKVTGVFNLRGGIGVTATAEKKR